MDLGAQENKQDAPRCLAYLSAAGPLRSSTPNTARQELADTKVCATGAGRKLTARGQHYVVQDEGCPPPGGLRVETGRRTRDAGGWEVQGIPKAKLPLAVL